MDKNRSFHQFSPLSDKFNEVDELGRVFRSSVVRPPSVVEVGYCLVDPVLRYLELSFYPTVLRQV